MSGFATVPVDHGTAAAAAAAAAAAGSAAAAAAGRPLPPPPSSSSEGSRLTPTAPYVHRGLAEPHARGKQSIEDRAAGRGFLGQRLLLGSRAIASGSMPPLAEHA